MNILMSQPMTYKELRHLELSLERYRIHYGTEENSEGLRYIIRLVGTRATKEQKSSSRVCSWCLNEHNDYHPDFCATCANKPPKLTIEEAKKNS